jgi:thiol-disulfide isomerase/thioredoxin
MKIIFLTLLFSLLTSGEFVEVNDSTFDNVLMSGEWLVMVFAPWCRSCQKFKPDWEKLKHLNSQDAFGYKINFAEINIVENSGLAARLWIQYIPSILHFKDGIVRTLEFGQDFPRNLESLNEWLKNKKYLTLEPWNDFYSPNNWPSKAMFYFGLFQGHVSHLMSQLPLENKQVIITLSLVTVLFSLIIAGSISFKTSRDQKKKAE